jgi:hypothetical protein
VPGFAMPVRVQLAGSGYTLIRPAESWQRVRTTLADQGELTVDRNFYVKSRKGARTR